MPIDHDIAEENWTRFQFCRDRGHLDFITKADRCEQFFAGQQWNLDDLAKLQDQKRPAMTINKIISTIGTILGEQIYNRTEVLFRPSNGSPAETADALTKVWMQISQSNQLPWVRSDVFCDGVVRGRGFYDMRMDFNESMQGVIKIALENSKNVVIDPDAEEYDPDSWADVTKTKWLTFQDIATLYNQDDADYLKDREGSAFPYGYDSIERVRDRFGTNMPLGGFYGTADPHGVRRNIRAIERQHRKLDSALHFVDIETGDMRLIPVDWDREKIGSVLQKAGGKLSTHKKLVKRIRWTVTADNVVLHDDWSPYRHFTIVPYFPYFRYGKTIGIVENLLGPQEILNKVSSQELHIVNTTANSGWILEGGSLINMSVDELENKGAQTGLVIEYAKGSQPPVKITPNQTPSGLDRISFKAEEHIKTISNINDSMQGNDREDVAAKAIAYKQQRGAVSMTKVLDNLERTDWILARNALDLIQDYYTEYRLLNITHEGPQDEQETIEINKYDSATGAILNDLTLGEYDITITSSPYRASIEDSQFEQARALKELGVHIPDDVLIENSRLQRRAEIIKRINAQAESPEAQAAKQLQIRGQTAEVAKTEAEVGKIQTQSQLDAARAQKEAQEAQGGQGGPSPEMLKLRQEHELAQQRIALERQNSDREYALKERQVQQELALKARAHDQDMQMRKDEMAQKMQQSRDDAVFKRAQQVRKDQESSSSTSEEQ